MEKVNIKKTGLTLAVCLLTGALLAQPSAKNLLGTAHSELKGQWTNFQGIMTIICALLFTGGIGFALYCYLYDQSRMKTATIALISSGLLLAIAASMQFLA